MLSITPCVSFKDKRIFENLPERLHGKNPAFIPPFPGSVVKYLSPQAAFNRVHGETHPFLAWRDGKPVGRIAAIINRSHNKYYKDTTVFFGFFDCEDNEETARALFSAVEKLLKGRGFSANLRGPYNPSINDECGLLTEGFDVAPFIGLTWNPAYYEKLVLAAGFSPVRKMFGLQLPLHRLDPPERLLRITDRVAAKSKLKLRPINLKKLKEELKIVHIVYNDTLERNWGFVPISIEDLYGAAEDMKAIADPAMILIADRDGKPAGVALSLPNFNEILIRLKDVPHWLRLPYVLWLMKTHRIRTGRQVVYGIVPEARDRGLHAWLLLEQFVKAKERFHDAELGWVEESNTEIMENCRMLGGIQHRTWKIFEKPLA